MTCFAVVLSGQARPQEHELKLALDPLLDLSKLWTLTANDLEQQFTASGFDENPFIRWTNNKQWASFTRQPFSNVSVDLSVLNEELPVESAAIVLDTSDHKAKLMTLSFGEDEGDSVAGLSVKMKGQLDVENKLRSKLTALLGSEPKPGPKAALGWKTEASVHTEIWSAPGAVALLESSGIRTRLTLARPGSDTKSILTSRSALQPPSRGRELAFFVRVDQAMPVPTVWGMSQEHVEKALELSGSSMKESPFLKWNTTTKDSARLARKLFSNTTTDLLLFDDTVNAEEVNLEFKDGRASKMICTLLTRGNSGKDIGAGEFDAVFKATGRALGTMLGVRPTRTTVAGKALSKTEGWLWTTPHTLALLEFNVDAPKGKVEFLRLTLTPAKARAELLNLAGLGDNATTRSRGSLASFVKRDPATGDVEITGVPMRDQGQKGYCVAASCERLFRYLGVPCDMDELAQLVSADAERGASPSVMYSSLTKIDQRYNMRVKLLKIPEGYGLGDALKSRGELDRAHKADLGKLIRENVDQGLPLLWCVMLAPGETGVSPGDEPKAPTSSFGPRVGHMRLITGYNAKTGGVIYTDSWGAGHERKVMTRGEAEAMTTAVFSMAPSR
jgi:hypothetical protein